MSNRPLTPADPAEVRDALSFALRYNRSGKRVQDRANLMADAAAEHLVEALRLNGFVVMRGAPAAAHDATGLPPERLLE